MCESTPVQDKGIISPSLHQYPHLCAVFLSLIDTSLSIEAIETNLKAESYQIRNLYCQEYAKDLSPPEMITRCMASIGITDEFVEALAHPGFQERDAVYLIKRLQDAWTDMYGKEIIPIALKWVQFVNSTRTVIV